MRQVPQLETVAEPSTSLKAKATRRVEELVARGETLLTEGAHGKGLLIGQKTLELAAGHLTTPQRAALEGFLRFQEKVALRQYQTVRPCAVEPTAGITFHQEIHSVSSMAVVADGTWSDEIPEGLAAQLVAARIAGVPKRMVLLKPDRAGGVSPLSLFVCHLGEATHVYRTGGVEGMVGLFEGWLGPVPNKVHLLGGNRLERIVLGKLVQREKKNRIDLVVLADSKAGVESILEILGTSIQDNPLLKAALVTTSKRVLKRVDQLMEIHPKRDAYWFRDLKQVQVLVQPSMEVALETLGSYMIDYLVPLSSQPEQVIASLSSVNHFVLGDTIGPLISKRALGVGSLGESRVEEGVGGSGIFNYLRTVTIEEVSMKAGERLKSSFRLLDRVDV